MSFDDQDAFLNILHLHFVLVRGHNITSIILRIVLRIPLCGSSRTLFLVFQGVFHSDVFWGEAALKRDSLSVIMTPSVLEKCALYNAQSSVVVLAFSAPPVEVLERQEGQLYCSSRVVIITMS
jgi:hypothetical protein